MIRSFFAPFRRILILTQSSKNYNWALILLWWAFMIFIHYFLLSIPSTIRQLDIHRSSSACHLFLHVLHTLHRMDSPHLSTPHNNRPFDMYFFSLTQSVSTLPFMEIRGCNVTSFLFRRSVRGVISVKYDSHYYFLSVKTYNFVKSRLQLSTKPTGVGCLVNSSRLNGQLQSAFND